MRGEYNCAIPTYRASAVSENVFTEGCTARNELEDVQRGTSWVKHCFLTVTCFHDVISVWSFGRVLETTEANSRKRLIIEKKEDNFKAFFVVL